jgi:hypothetical protein
MVRYLAYTKVIDALHMVNLLYDDVFLKFRFSRSIILDRGSLFISVWWFTFYYDFTVKRRLSTAFHP